MPASSRAQVGIAVTASSNAVPVGLVPIVCASFDVLAGIVHPQVGLKSSPGDEQLLIGELASRAGVRPSTVRYYEAIGLLPEPLRISGRRRYGAETLRALAVIGTAQRAG